jgi:hypothetical protein
MTPEWLKLLAAVAAAFRCYELLVQFDDWNRTQSCATSGRRNRGERGSFRLRA